jgi:hypothetical protein
MREPKTEDELFSAINSMCVVIGASSRAYEIYHDHRYIHETYGYIYDCEDDEFAIKKIWMEIREVIDRDKNKRPLIFWRRRPNITQGISYQETGYKGMIVKNKSRIDFRVSIGNEFTKGSYVPFSKHVEGSYFRILEKVK